MYGHEYFIHLYLNSDPLNIPLVLQEKYILIVFACFYSVDVFFFLSGFFLGYIAADESKLKQLNFKKPLNYFAALLHRLFRIWPCYIFAILFYWQLLVYVDSSPTWNLAIDGSLTCGNKGFWQAIFFTDILNEDTRTNCFGWGWYLQCEWWIFVASVFLMMFYAQNKFLGKMMIFATLIASQTYNYYIFYSNDY